jgi:hypothetical protein
MWQQGKRLSRSIGQGQNRQVQTHDHCPAMLMDVPHTLAGGKAAVGNQQVSRRDVKPTQRLADRGVGDVDLIAGQRGQPHRVMQSPGRPRCPRLVDRRAINDANPQACIQQRPDRPWRHPAMHQFLADPAKPFAAHPQPLEQRHIRDRHQLPLSRPHRRFAQRTALRQVDQHDTQQCRRIREPPAASQGPQLARLVLPTQRQHTQHDLPIFRNAGQDVIVHPRNDTSIARRGSTVKLALMPFKGEGLKARSRPLDGGGSGWG